MDSEKVRALSNFYREEFQRHLDHLQTSGAIVERTEIDRLWRFLDDIDRVCWRSDFPTVAETLLRNFETLSRLSESDPRRGH